MAEARRRHSRLITEGNTTATDLTWSHGVTSLLILRCPDSRVSPDRHLQNRDASFLSATLLHFIYRLYVSVDASLCIVYNVYGCCWRDTGDVDGWRLVTFVPGLIPLSCAG